MLFMGSGHLPSLSSRHTRYSNGPNESPALPFATSSFDSSSASNSASTPASSMVPTTFGGSLLSLLSLSRPLRLRVSVFLLTRQVMQKAAKAAATNTRKIAMTKLPSADDCHFIWSRSGWAGITDFFSSKFACVTMTAGAADGLSIALDPSAVGNEAADAATVVDAAVVASIEVLVCAVRNPKGHALAAGTVPEVGFVVVMGSRLCGMVIPGAGTGMFASAASCLGRSRYWGQSERTKPT
mmetsp:Transcript_87055/g.244139  ORF Transcript_87055/g.244139 Transcript_87055/m.244139 type:complete len:240 (+) Transcript_87055:44-763(+)